MGTPFDLKFEDSCTVLREPSSEELWKMWAQSHGLTIKLLERLPKERAQQLREGFITFHKCFRTDLGITMPRDYLLTVGVRK